MKVKTSRGELPVRYGWNALAKFGDISGFSMDEILELDLGKMKISDVLNFVYVGFVEGARREKEECKVENAEDVGDLIDDDPDLITRVMDVFSDMTAAPGGGEDSKKK